MECNSVFLKKFYALGREADVALVINHHSIGSGKDSSRTLLFLDVFLESRRRLYNALVLILEIIQSHLSIYFTCLSTTKVLNGRVDPIKAIFNRVANWGSEWIFAIAVVFIASVQLIPNNWILKKAGCQECLTEPGVF